MKGALSYAFCRDCDWAVELLGGDTSYESVSDHAVAFDHIVYSIVCEYRMFTRTVSVVDG